MNLMSIVTTTGAVVSAMLPLLVDIAPARAADSVAVRGTILDLDGSMLRVKTGEGENIAVALKDDWKLEAISRAVPDDIKPGEFVGIASTPTTPAGDHSHELLIFSPVLDDASKCAYASVLRTRDALSATVSYKNPDGRTLTVSYHGLERRLAIADDTTVLTLVRANRTELAVGAAVFLTAERSAAGALTAGLVIVDGDGALPPM